MTTQLERASIALFPSEGSAAHDIKFFPGWSTTVTAEQRAEQFNRAESQIASGQVQPLVSIDRD
jgi:uncharacterized protein YcnI